MNEEASMGAGSTLKGLTEAVDALTRQVGLMRTRMLTVGGEPLSPRLHLRGQYEGFDPESEALAVRIEGTSYWYPLADYQCAVLPVPRAQVLVLAEPDSGAGGNVTRPLVFGFEIDGRAIPVAPRVRARVEQADVLNGIVSLYVEDRIVLLEGLDERLAQFLLSEDSPMLRYIRVPPHEYWIPDNWQPPEDEPLGGSADEYDIEEGG